MAVPFRRTSKTKKRMRRTHLKKTARSVVNCPNCGAPIQPHRACVSCGFYKGKDVLGIQEKEENTKTEVKKEEVKEVKKAPAKKTTTTKKTSKKETKEK